MTCLANAQTVKWPVGTSQNANFAARLTANNDPTRKMSTTCLLRGPVHTDAQLLVLANTAAFGWRKVPDELIHEDISGFAARCRKQNVLLVAMASKLLDCFHADSCTTGENVKSN
jgi:hypothetical protein